MFDTKHLEKNNMTYMEHLWRAMWLSFLFFMGGVFTVVHAFFPWILTSISTDFNKTIYEILNEKHIKYNYDTNLDTSG